jgi:hypothetical protein
VGKRPVPALSISGGCVTTEQALAIIWVATMVALGFVWQRMKHWKARHDFDHGMMVRLSNVLETTMPTHATFALMDEYNRDPNIPVKMFLEPETPEAREQFAKVMKGDQ